MTDEQWLWLLANRSLDNDEKLEQLCDKCRDEATSHDKCIRCGKPLTKSVDDFVNPNFDVNRFNKLKNDEDINIDNLNKKGADIELFKQVHEQE